MLQRYGAQRVTRSSTHRVSPKKRHACLLAKKHIPCSRDLQVRALVRPSDVRDLPCLDLTFYLDMDVPSCRSAVNIAPNKICRSVIARCRWPTWRVRRFQASLASTASDSRETRFSFPFCFHPGHLGGTTRIARCFEYPPKTGLWISAVC